LTQQQKIKCNHSNRQNIDTESTQDRRRLDYKISVKQNLIRRE